MLWLTTDACVFLLIIANKQIKQIINASLIPHLTFPMQCVVQISGLLWQKGLVNFTIVHMSLQTMQDHSQNAFSANYLFTSILLPYFLLFLPRQTSWKYFLWSVYLLPHWNYTILLNILFQSPKSELFVNPVGIL